MLNSEKMVASIGQQDLIRADKYFQRALTNDPVEALLELAEYLESIGFLPQAKEIYDKFRYDYPEVNINLAQIAAEDGEFEKAFLYLDAVAEDSEDYLSALLVMADLYQMEGLTDVAKDKLLQASHLTDEPLVTFGLAEITYELGHFEEAISYYASLDNRDILATTGVSTYQRIGRAYAELGKFEAAIEFLEKAVEIEYDDTTIFELATLYYDQENFQRANFYFKQLETMNQDFEGYEYLYAQSLHGEHKTEEALRLVQKGLTRNEFDLALLLAASQFSYELHDKGSAESYLKAALTVAEDDEEVLLRLTNLYLEDERYEDIIALEREDLNHVVTLWTLARAHWALENDEEAFEAYQKLEQDLAQNPEYLEEYSRLLREFGYRDKAREVAQAYLAIVPDDLQMQEFLRGDDQDENNLP